jgi:hypothetical protein
MAKKPESTKPISWNVYKTIRLVTIDAPDKATAIEKAAAEFKAPANRLTMVERRRSPLVRSGATRRASIGCWKRANQSL